MRKMSQECLYVLPGGCRVNAKRCEAAQNIALRAAATARKRARARKAFTLARHANTPGPRARYCPQGHEDRRRRKRVKACSVTHLCGGGAGMRAGGHASRTRTLPIASAARCCDVMRGPRTARYRAVQGDTGQISVRPLNRMRSVQRVRPMRFRARLLPRTLWRPGGPYARLVPASASTGFRDRQAGLFQPHMYALSGSRAFHRFLRASQAPVRLPTYSKVVP